MDASRFSSFRRLVVPISNGWGSGEMTVLEFGDPDPPVDLIFAHANGFNALTYRSLLEPLAETMRIWAPDLRGHGATTLPVSPEGRRGWRDHADDLTALLDRFDEPVALAGHSMGATAALLAAAERPERVSGLVLLEPVIWARWAVRALHLPGLDRMAGRVPLVRNALRRRPMFESQAEAFAAYQGRGAFKDWPAAVLEDYLSDGLIQTPKGWRLTCDPAWEASNYAAQTHDPWQALRHYRGPVRILKGEFGSTCHVPMTLRALPNISVEIVPGGTHFFPMLRADVARNALFDPAI